jgi:hypothetical protein
MNSLTKDMEAPEGKEPVKIFNSIKAINANTTEMVGRGKMDFRVTHNFDDIDGKGGMIARFLGMDNAKDLRIGFHIGLTDNLDISIARIKGAGAITQNASGSAQRFYELALKFRIMEQRENDPSHPFAVAIFASNAVAASKKSDPPNTNFENSFTSFSDRMSQTIQLIIAKKIGKVSVQLNPTWVNTNHVVQHDDKSMFAIGGAVRFPIVKHLNMVVDYFHPFRSKSSKAYFNSVDNSYIPPNDLDVNSVPFKFYDPLGIGFEITTAGHVFLLNFTNSAEILDNRFIRFTNKSWTQGKSRWCFTIQRKFSLWKPKK